MMSLKIIQTLIVVIALSIPLTYSTEELVAEAPTELVAEAPAELVAEAPAELERRGLESTGNKDEIVRNLQETIPKYELYLMKVVKHIDEGPESTPAETCLVECMKTYDKEIEELKKFVRALSQSSSGEVEFQSTINKEELLHCDKCLLEVSKEDPRVGQDIEWFIAEIEAVSKQMSAYNS